MSDLEKSQVEDGASWGGPPAALAMAPHFREFAAYNQWANQRLYEDVSTVSREDLHGDISLYFGSLFGTLVHILRTDRAWMFLLQGGELANLQQAAAPTELEDLARSRRECDDEMVAWIETLTEARLSEPFTFVSGLKAWKGMRYTGTRGGVLTHLFNHQTHHRGQAHAALTILGLSEPQGLDILVKGFR